MRSHPQTPTQCFFVAPRDYPRVLVAHADRLPSVSKAICTNNNHHPYVILKGVVFSSPLQQNIATSFYNYLIFRLLALSVYAKGRVDENRLGRDD